MFIVLNIAGLGQLQELLAPLNVVFLGKDNEELISIIDQEKYTIHQNPLEDDNYLPSPEEIALILSTNPLDMSSKLGSKLLGYFKVILLRFVLNSIKIHKFDICHNLILNSF